MEQKILQLVALILPRAADLCTGRLRLLLFLSQSLSIATLILLCLFSIEGHVAHGVSAFEEVKGIGLYLRILSETFGDKCIL